MDANTPDIDRLKEQLEAAERDAQALTAGLDQERGAWRATTVSWSVAQCLDHLANANRVYLQAMREAANGAAKEGKLRRGPLSPGLLGRWFIRTLEPPVKAPFRIRAPRSIAPEPAPLLADAFDKFTMSQTEVREFLRLYAHLDLGKIRFRNPFVRGLRFSLVTGLHIIAAHERRHLWQAWRVRRVAESSTGVSSATGSTRAMADSMRG